MQRLAALALGFAAWVAPGCFVFNRATVGVDRVGSKQVAAELEASALTGMQPSAGTLLALHYYGLSELYERDPEDAIVALHRGLLADPWRDFAFALAELCFLVGKRTGDRDHYLGSAVYAYLYLLGEEWPGEPNPYDRRFRWACEFYNRGLRQALLDPDREKVLLTGGRRALPVGSIELTVDRSGFPESGSDFTFLPADDYDVWGLSLRVRDSGLGVPLVASTPRPLALAPIIPPGLRSSFVPATAFLRLSGGMADLERGIPATLELRSAFDAQSVQIGEREIPLESDLSAALALALDRSNVWSFSVRGFFEGNTVRENGIRMVQPYQPGRIPVLFVHGTASNPGNWAEMFNLLEADALLRRSYQFWFYLYSTGLPLPFSSARLRQSLQELVAALDPEGRDPALRRMVLIGHSQGGLLARMMVVDGSLDWWEEFFGQPLEEMGLSPEQEDLVRRGLDFDPLPFVERVIFMATPHHGSYLADRWFSRLAAKMISLPNEISELGESLLRNETRLPRGMERQIPTSLDSMETDNPFLALLARQPFAPNVKAHSIIPVRDAGPDELADARDGVVAYRSAHIEGVESELCLPGGHSCQGSPRAIREVRRILHEHLETAAGE